MWRVPALTLAVLLTAVTVAEARCPRVDEPRASSRHALVWEANESLFGCLDAASRRVRMARDIGFLDTAAPVRLAGRHVAFGLSQLDRYENRNELLAVPLWDLRRRVRVRRPTFQSRFLGNAAIADLELRSTGSYALTLTSPWDGEVEVWLVPRRGALKLLDSGPHIDPVSLERDRDEVLWRADGVTQRAVLP